MLWPPQRGGGPLTDDQQSAMFGVDGRFGLEQEVGQAVSAFDSRNVDVLELGSGVEHDDDLVPAQNVVPPVTHLFLRYDWPRDQFTHEHIFEHCGYPFVVGVV